jgi:TRAP-type mannitol/chloroaromatic compound transport system permease small subunit
VKETTVSDSAQPAASLLGRLDRALARVELVTAAIAGLTIFFLMLFAIVNIALRKFSDFLLWAGVESKPAWVNPVFGYIDVVELSMVLFAVLCIAYTQRLGGHVRMEILLNRLSGRPLWIVEALTTSAAIGIIAVLGVYSINYFLDAYNIGDSTIDAELPTWPAKLVIPVAFAILMARLLLQLAGFLRLAAHPDATPVAVPLIEKAEEVARHEIEGATVELDEIADDLAADGR